MTLPARGASGPAPANSLLVAAVLVFFAISGCGGGQEGTPAGEQTNPWLGVSAAIPAAQGGTLVTPGGFELEIPAQALPRDTTVTVTPFPGGSFGPQFFAGLRIEPEGLSLNLPATCRFPLPPAWDGNEEPLAWEFAGSDPADFLDTGRYADLTGTPGAYVAETRITHFSGPMLARNCHAGTWQHVLASFRARGCSHQEAMATIQNYTDPAGNKPFANMRLPDDSTAYCPANIEADKSGEEVMQAFARTFFQEMNTYNAGENVSDIGKLLEYARDTTNGRKVMLAFSGGQWEQRPDGMYRSYMHTATLELRNGQVKLRNTVSAPDDIVNALVARNGDNVFWYPKQGELTPALLNQFRQGRSAEALEVELCGEPGCLEDKSKNNLGIDRYQNMPLATRTRPWTAVKIYVEKARARENPCRAAETALAAAVFISGHYATDFVADSDKVKAALSRIEDGIGHVILDNIPAIVGTSGSLQAEMDQLSVSLSPALAGPGAYDSVGSVFDLAEGREAGINFASTRVRDQDLVASPVLFSAASGIVMVDNFGKNVGDRISGSFDVNISGERMICEDPGCENWHDEVLTGTLSGSFNGVLGPAEGGLSLAWRQGRLNPD